MVLSVMKFKWKKKTTFSSYQPDQVVAKNVAVASSAIVADVEDVIGLRDVEVVADATIVVSVEPF